MAPNITLALEILRMPTMELQTFLEHQLEENPLLEMEESTESNEAETPESSQEQDEREPSLDEEWLEHWRTTSNEEERDNERTAEQRLEQRLTVPQSLYEALRLQLGCQDVPEPIRRAGEAIIGQLNEYGYLETSLEQIIAEAGLRREDTEAALRLIQRLEPPGVGARDLRECLLIQLEQQNEQNSLAYRILRDCFPLFAQGRLSAIAKATAAPPDDVTRACEAIKRLNPKPGRAFASDLPSAVVPDLLIHHRERHYDVELNDQWVPRVLVSRAYYRMLKDPRTPPDAKEFLTTKFRQASWLIKAMDERNATLLAVARCLISLQRDFLEHGPRALKPLNQAQVASSIGRHPSTVSRAICGKTIDTPYGVFRLEQLFASGVPQAGDNGSVSDEQIKSEMQRLIADENPQQPFSDAALTQRLAQRQMTVARRTVAKYRIALKILPAHLRRHRF